MRHLKSGRKLGVTPSHRRAMMRNMAVSALVHQKVQTTLAKAKELRRPLEKMIALGKRGDLSARRKALAFVHDKQAIANLFGEFAERYRERNGGFVRILRLSNRRGDGAPLALLILVDGPKDPYSGEKRNKAHKKDKQVGPTQKKTSASTAREKGTKKPSVRAK